MPSAAISRKHRGQKPRKYLITNILPCASASNQDKNHNSLTIPHKPLCERLLPLTTAWENFFIRSIIALPALTLPQEEKLKKIAERYFQPWEEGGGRLCKHCGKKAQIIDEYSYFCRQCGNCLQFPFGGAK
jgi:hypothetical protein